MICYVDEHDSTIYKSGLIKLIERQ